MKKTMIAALTMLMLAGCVTESGPHLTPDQAYALAQVRTKLGADYYQRKQYGIALEQLSKAVDADPGYAPAYDVRALVHAALMQDDDAVEDFEHSLSLDPTNSDTHNNYGWYLCHHGKEREGVKHFLKAVKDPLYATPYMAYLNAAKCSQKIGKMKDAEIYLERALILQPEYPDALLAMADLAFDVSDFDRAHEDVMRYEQIAGADNLTAANLLLAVRIEHALGNRQAESSYAARLINKYPDSRETKLLEQVR